MSENAENLELLWGVEAISAFIGRNQRQTFYMLSSSELPAKKVGGRWVADRKKLEQFFSEVTA